jgi:hypothetical protein
MNDCSELVVQLAVGVQLLVRQFDHYSTFTVLQGKYPHGETLVFVIGERSDPPRISTKSDVPCLWSGQACFELPWLELLKVADFLKLQIALPHEPGQQVPA